MAALLTETVTVIVSSGVETYPLLKRYFTVTPFCFVTVLSWTQDKYALCLLMDLEASLTKHA